MDIEDDNFDWIEEFNRREKDYDKFYKTLTSDVLVYLLFIDRSGEVNKFEALHIKLDNNGILTRDSLLKLVEKGKQNKKYNFQGMLKYNITIDPENVEKLLKDRISGDEYLTYTKNIEDTKFNDTIEMFQNLNNVILLFREKLINIVPMNKTKRNYKGCLSKTRKIPTKHKHT